MRVNSVVLAALASMLIVPPTAAKVENRYAKWKLGKLGYRDLSIQPNRWKVRGLSIHAGLDFTVAVALYRMAILAKANGFERFYAVSLIPSCTGASENGGYGTGACSGTFSSEEVDIIAVGYGPESPKPVCEEKRQFAENCEDFEVTEVLSRYRGSLNTSLEQEQQEIATAPRGSTDKRRSRNASRPR